MRKAKRPRASDRSDLNDAGALTVRRDPEHVEGPTMRKNSVVGNRVVPGDADGEAKKSGVPAFAMTWQDVGPNRPSEGRQLVSSRLTDALAVKTQFTKKEWDAFGMPPLRIDDYIKVGNSFFQPKLPGGKDFKDEQKQKLGKAEKGNKTGKNPSGPYWPYHAKSLAPTRQPPVSD